MSPATNAIFDRRAIPAGAALPSWTAPDGTTLRCFVWPQREGATPRGSILFLVGRGDLFEKYLESFAHWHARGWTVTSFDWRGQGGSGRLTPAGDCGHIDDFASYVADLKAFFDQWRAATPGPHVVVGHSMGGHILLRAMVEAAIRPDAAVLVAPMLGVKGPLGRFSETAARMLGGVGNSARPAWRENERPYTARPRQLMLTHDVERYQDELWWHRQQPGLFTGPPSWRWLIEAFRTTRELRGNPAVRKMAVPVLALVAEKDALVDARAALGLLAKLPDARIVRFGPESAHEILRESDAVRNRAIGEIDLFLEARARAQ